ncbi:MAG TPA: hypothetical protein VI423_04870 [Paenisporosarcina sp.]|nr:hypothetical protein [Paenisporosarcina sp.]
MNRKATNHTIAKAVRVEYEPKSDAVYLVFEVTDERFKQVIRKDWMQDMDVKIIGRELIEDD